jgi:phage shock protein PspC (stress-responsive transcriptional regulator)
MAAQHPGAMVGVVRMNSGNGTKVLVRSRKGRMVAGICAGIAEYFGADVTLVRVIVAAIAVITGGAGALAYLVAWAIIPEEGEKTSIADNLIGQKQDASSR